MKAWIHEAASHPLPEGLVDGQVVTVIQHSHGQCEVEDAHGVRRTLSFINVDTGLEFERSDGRWFHESHRLVRAMIPGYIERLEAEKPTLNVSVQHYTDETIAGLRMRLARYD